MASTAYHIKNENEMYFVTLTIVDWADIFTRKAYREIVIDSLKFCQQNKGLEIYGWVIMSNHIHAILRAKVGFKLSGIIRDFKTFTTKQVIDSILTQSESRREWLMPIFRKDLTVANNKIWQDGNHAIECFSPKFTLEKLNYIHQNPIRAGIVAEAEHYLYSSAGDYAGIKGILDVILLD